MSSPEPAAGIEARGADFLTEIREQPAALRALLEHESSYSRVAMTARDRGATTIRMVGHGSSDNAASYGVYAFGLLPRWTALRDSITLTAYYDARLDMTGSTVIALSHKAQREASPAKRAVLYAKIQRIAAQDAFQGFLYYSPYRWAYSSKLHGFLVQPLGNYHLEDAWLG